MRLVWITLVRGVMAIMLGLAFASHHDRAPAALANFMGVYWILNGMVTFQWGLSAETPRRRLPLLAGAIGIVTGAVVLLVDVGKTFLLALLGFVIALTGSSISSVAWSSPTCRAGGGVRSAARDHGARAGDHGGPDIGSDRVRRGVARERVGSPGRVVPVSDALLIRQRLLASGR